MSRRASLHAFVIAALLPIMVVAQGPASDTVPAAAKGIIRGVVTAADTGRPIRRAEVRIQSSNLTPLIARSVFTDEQGRYEVTGLRAGRYGLTAVRAGYLTLAYGQVRARESGRLLELSESTPLDKIDVALPRAGVIVTRVTDRFGDPVRGVVVRAYLPRFIEGRRQLSSAGGTTTVTDDRGESRIYGLFPGDYYVMASPADAEFRSEVETLFPGTVNINDAQTVRVGVGEEVFTTFPILRARPSTLSGRILGSDGLPLAAPRVSLQQRRLSGFVSGGRLNVAADGTFHEENLAPAEWVVVVNEPEFGSASAHLVGDDVHGLTVITHKTADVRGRVTFEGAPPPAQGIELSVTFEGPRTMATAAGFVRSGGRSGAIPVGPANDWTFEAQISGTGVIRARADGWMLKAVLLDGKDVTDSPLDFGRAYAGKRVEVVLTQRRSQVNGSVSNERGQPVSDYVVVTFPEDEALWTSSRFIRVARPDQQGRFAIDALPAGRYRVTALEYLEPGDERNPETLSRLRLSATTVAVSEGESRSVTLRMSR